MTAAGTIVAGLLFAVSTNAQKDVRQESSSSGSAGLQPWLLGLTAMVVFLFIVFLLLIVNRLWCKKKRGDDEEDRAARVQMNVYDNEALEEEMDNKLKTHEKNKKAKGKWMEGEGDESRVTAM
ncbi:small integral membrane protein 24 [Eleutherodactylus coqui]|uniref:Small integral membrane protein 24 n=1 Tax=Eleutherodactylus coqui TaxID=57060 RepID=A0A8J6JXB3_ELECQ|nr:hypothetical protein GDO78_013796 [Eleutherodactylus coqui]